MKRKKVSLVIVLFLLVLMYEMLNHPSNVINSVRLGILLWSENVFSSLFPFIFISEILISYGFVQFLGEIFSPFMNKFFGISGNASFALIMSMFSGTPGGAKYTTKLLEKNLITKKEAEKIIMWTHFTNPIFILGTIAISFLNCEKLGFLILLIHFSCNFILGFLLRNYEKSPYKKEKISLKRAFLKMSLYRESDERTLGEIINNSIMNSLEVLFLILGVIIFFLIVVNIVDQNITLSIHNKTWLTGILEVTQGLRHLSLTNLPLKVKTTLATFFISFGGFSIHLQVISIISKYKIRYFPYFVARFIHAGMASILIFFLFDFYV